MSARDLSLRRRPRFSARFFNAAGSSTGIGSMVAQAGSEVDSYRNGRRAGKCDTIGNRVDKRDRPGKTCRWQIRKRTVGCQSQNSICRSGNQVRSQRIAVDVHVVCEDANLVQLKY
jgi:hypothetical protein